MTDRKPQDPNPDDPTPAELHREAADAAEDMSFQMTTCTSNLRPPWSAVDKMLMGIPFLPGWLIVIGGRAKAGKSTILRHLFQAWVELGKRVLYVGTEQGAHVLRMLYACARLQVPARAAIDVTHPDHLKVLADVVNAQSLEADRAVIVAEQGLNMQRFTYWAGWAYRHQFDAVLLDHFHRMDTGGGGDRYGTRSDAARRLKDITERAGYTLVAAAQLRNGDGGQLLGEHEVPGAGSWAETQSLRREADVAIQAWKPFRPGTTAKQKSAAKDDQEALGNIVWHGVMAMRLDAHRYLNAEEAPPKTLLRVSGGEIRPFLEVEQGTLGVGNG